MSATFVVDPMDAQKPWQMSLGPLLCLWVARKMMFTSQQLQSPKLAKLLTKAKSHKMGGTTRDDREQTQMSAFVVDPMDAQKPWQMSLGPLLRLGALEKYICLSAAPKLAKSLTKAKLNKMGGTTR